MNHRDQPKGFSEQPQQPLNGFPALPDLPTREHLRLGEGGRFVIPASMRTAMGVKPGDKLILFVEDGELRVRGQRAGIERVRKIADKHKKPGENIVDEFISDRRSMWGEK